MNAITEQPKAPNDATVACVFCGTAGARYWFTKNDCRIFRCSACDGGFVHPIPSATELHAFYTSLSPEASSCADVLAREKAFPNGSIDARRIAKTLVRFGAIGRALDVGAGNGFFSKALCAEGYEVEAIELSANARQVFREMNGFEAADVFFDSDFAAHHAGRFGAVLLSQVLEHLPMDTSPIKSIHTLLEKNGICAIAVPHFRSLVSRIQGKRDMFITPPEHINYFTIASLRTVFEGHGFRVLAVNTISRYDFSKLRRRIGRLDIVAAPVLKSAFAVSDLLNRGMFINLYAQKL